jgi:hypothetical protein
MVLKAQPKGVSDELVAASIPDLISKIMNLVTFAEAPRSVSGMFHKTLRAVHGQWKEHVLIPVMQPWRKPSERIIVCIVRREADPHVPVE